jgi:predicted DNA-binding protein
VADVSVRDRETRAYKRLILNVPPELHDRLRGMAERERRPLTTQVQILIERALAADEIEGAGSGLVPA